MITSVTSRIDTLVHSLHRNERALWLPKKCMQTRSCLLFDLCFIQDVIFILIAAFSEGGRGFDVSCVTMSGRGLYAQAFSIWPGFLQNPSSW